MQAKKPILYLFRKSSKNLKDPALSYSFGLLNEKMTIALYDNLNDLAKAVRSFLKENETTQKEITFKLKAQTLEKLEALATREGKNLNRTLNDLIEKET